MTVCTLRIPVAVALLLASLACGAEADGFADVTGEVRHASGLPIASSTVAISCPRIGVATTVATDSQGHYSVALVAPSAGVRHSCSFGVPDLVMPLVRVDTVIGFAEGLHAQQFVDLTAP